MFDGSESDENGSPLEYEFEYRLSRVSRGRLDIKLPTRPSNVSSLKEMSAVTIAVALWKHVNIPRVLSITCKCTRKSYGWRTLCSKVRNLKCKLPLPAGLCDYIEWYIVTIEIEIHDWVQYHLRTVFFNNGSDYLLYYHIYDTVWYPNGTINSKETAKKLLSSTRLSDIEKFRLLSTYCLKTQMKKIPRAVFSDQVMDSVSFEQYPLICYWAEYVKNRQNHSRTPSRHLAENIRMARHKKVDNWHAKEYFFDRLSSHEQLQCAKTLITDYGLEYQQLILLKLDEIQRIQLYTDYAVEILTNYARSHKNLDEFLQTWLEMRNLITKDQFLDIFKQLLNSQADETILMDVWKEASSQFKSHVLNYNNHEVIEKIFFYYKHSGRSEPLLALLSDIKSWTVKKITKKEYFGDFCEELLNRDKISILDQVLRLFFPKSEQLVDFKRNLVINSEAVKQKCTSDYKRHGDVNMVNEYLNSLMPNRPEDILEYKKSLFMSDSGIEIGSSYLCSDEKRTILREIIADGLPTEDLATEFNKKLINSSSAICVLRYNITHHCMDELKKCLNTYFESEEEKRTMKKKLLNDVRVLRKLFVKMSNAECKSILRWFLENDEDTEEFKMTLATDAVFDEVLKYCVFRRYDEDHRVSMCTFRRDPDFGFIDLFLEWYFSTANKINRYKLQRVNSWKDIEMITTLLKKKDEKYLKAVMSWFFQKATPKQILVFKKKFAGEKIVRMV